MFNFIDSVTLQEQADTFASKEVAISMGLGNQTLPWAILLEDHSGFVCSVELLDKTKSHLSISSIAESQKCMKQEYCIWFAFSTTWKVA